MSEGDPFALVDSDNKASSTDRSTPQQQTGTVYLPADDGKPLSPDELNALMSEGVVDCNIPSEEMRDVILHFKHLVHKDRYTVEKNVERGQFYMPYILELFREKGLPDDVAYIAFIESGFNPMARSRTGAMGMWQFVSATGKQYGMEQDWWMDERRDPYQATRSAAEYLSRLYKLFDDWHLAITAYNAGEGKISRGLAATGAKSFFELRRRNDNIPNLKDQLTDENKQYLPKFLAVCKIMRNLDTLGFSSMNLGQAPRLTELRVKPGTDLMGLAKSAGMSWEDFSRHNPAYHRYVSPPGRHTTVYIPHTVAHQAKAFLRKPQATSVAGWNHYTIRRGDTMSGISRKLGIPIAELRRLNQISEPLKVGRKLRIPMSGRAVATATTAPEPVVARSSAPRRNAPAKTESVRVVVPQQTKAPARSVAASAPAHQSATRVHEVAKGDTIYSIAQQYGVSQRDLLTVNCMDDSRVRLGQHLIIPTEQRKAVQTAASSVKRTASDAGKVKARSSGKVASKTTTSTTAVSSGSKKASQQIVQYRVQQGDSLWGIARKFNVSPIDLLALNNMEREDKLRPGDTVRVAVN